MLNNYSALFTDLILFSNKQTKSVKVITLFSYFMCLSVLLILIFPKTQYCVHGFLLTLSVLGFVDNFHTIKERKAKTDVDLNPKSIQSHHIIAKMWFSSQLQNHRLYELGLPTSCFLQLFSNHGLVGRLKKIASQPKVEAATPRVTLKVAPIT